MQEQYAIKTIIISSALRSGPFVDLDENVLYRLPTVQWTNFINVHDVWKEETTSSEKLCIRMDIATTTLRVLIRDLKWTFNSTAAWLDVMRGIANGLSNAHFHNIIHGDLKPSNGLSG